MRCGDLAQAIGKNLNPEAIAKSLLTLSIALGKTFEPSRNTILKTLKGAVIFSASADEAGKRSLKGLIMSYAVISKSKPAMTEIIRDYKKSDNMTNRFNALRTIVHYHPDKSEREKVLAHFYKRYCKNYIVLDKWFSVQASSPRSTTITEVRKLMKHEDFTFNNPNRFRSLAFRSYRSLESSRRKLAHDALLKIEKSGELSRDTTDILTRTLNG